MIVFRGPRQSVTAAGRATKSKSRPTIHDVARLAGVSIGTVSKALNGGGKLRDDTRSRVQQAAKQLAFRPNEMALSLHRGRSLTIGLISRDNFGRFGLPIMEGLEECMADQSIAVFMCNATDDPAREARHLESLLSKQVDGIVVTARRSDPRPKLELPAGSLPVIYVYAQADDADALCLVPDDEGGARQATEHLIRLGRRRIAHVTGPEAFEAVRLRRAGYRQALANAGLACRADFCLPGRWSESWGRQVVDELFHQAGTRPDAFVCGSDQIARGVADALRERGVGVPEDVSLTGFDNWQILAEATRPALTTVDMNLKDLGREAGRCLMELVSGGRLKGVRRLPCSLVVRDSCGAKLLTQTQEPQRLVP